MLDYAGILVAILAMIGLAAMIMLFLKRKGRQHSTDQTSDGREKVANSQLMNAEDGRVKPHSPGEIDRAKEELRILNIRRQITTSAMTSIFEAEAQGNISLASRNELIETYKAQLKALDEEIAEKRKITELSDLMDERQELVKSFEQRIVEIDERLRELNAHPASTPPIPSLGNPLKDPVKADNSTTTPRGDNSSEEKRRREKVKSRADERLDAIREEVLKALERLQQIESEDQPNERV